MCAHIYGRFIHVHLYTADLCVCVHMCHSSSYAEQRSCPLLRERLLTVSVWLGLRLCTVAALPRGENPEHHRPELSQGLSYTRVGKGTENSTTHSASRVRQNQGLRVGAVFVQEKLRQSSKRLRLNI